MNATITEANRLFEEGEFASALEMYRELMESSEIWKRVLVGNYKICLAKLRSNSSGVNLESIDWSLLGHVDLATRKKVLVADFRYPRFDSSAGELATYGIIKIFVQLGHEVVFIPKESTEYDTPYIRALRRLGVKCIENVSYENFKDKVLENSKDLYVAYIFRPDVARLCMPVIRATSPDVHIFYHAPDVYFRRESAQLTVEGEGGGKSGVDLKRINQIVLDEVYAAVSADHVVCVSDGDAIALKGAMNDPSLNMSDLALPEISTFPVLYLERKAALPEFSTAQNICFVGSSEHHPNSDAIRWFLENVWERLSSQNPGLCFHVIGKTNETEKAYYQKFKNVVVVGWVDSVEETLPNYKLTVAPLRFGAGIKGKVGTSLIVGVPCVASSVAVEDMGLVQDEEIILAATVDDYVHKITRLLNNEEEWLKLSRKGAAKAEQLYSHEATFQRFIRILNDNNVLDTKHYLDFISRLAKTKKAINFPDLGANAEIDVSIVIPGFNNLELTKMCLASIYYSILPSDSTRYEVIYADDCSEENVIPELTSQFGNVLVTRTDANGGFVVNCNTGASKARGNFLVLLNNDVIVLPSWLDGLYQVVNASEKCFVAGSKMLYSDGAIQEAGASLFTDGRSCNHGRGEDYLMREWNYIREVDYVSFASIIVRRSFWVSQGGLSTEYGLGYFDDSDFCMRVRNANGVILYAPESEVIHNESATFGLRDQREIQNEKKRNYYLFRKKWADRLIYDHFNYTCPHWHTNYYPMVAKATAARHAIQTNMSRTDSKRRSVLYYAPFPSHPASHGNQTTIQKFGKFLQTEGHKVHFVLLRSHLFTEKDAEDMAAAWDTFDIIEIPDLPGCNGKDIPFDGWYIEGLGEKIAVLCEQYGIDVVICSYIFQSRMLEYVPAHILKIIDTHDLFTDRYDILDKLGKPREFFSCTQREEGWYLSRADVALARRDEERDYFAKISTAKVFTVPHIEEKRYLNKATLNLGVVGIVSSANLINLDIVIKFISELMRQKSQGWGFSIVVAGQVKDLVDIQDPVQARVVNHPQVNFLGFVDDITDFYRQVDLIVCPIMSGTGINVKTVQALAHGMPLLATQHATKGVDTCFANHQFKDVAALVTYLLSNSFTANILSEFSEQSKRVFDGFIAAGNENFRQAISLTQPGLRLGIGNALTLEIDNALSKKCRLKLQHSTRKELRSSSIILETIVSALENYGPSEINLNAPLPNMQATGGVGFWFKLNREVFVQDDLFLVIRDIHIPLRMSSCSSLLTCEIPAKHLCEEGKFPLFIRTRGMKRESNVGEDFIIGKLAVFYS